MIVLRFLIQQSVNSENWMGAARLSRRLDYSATNRSKLAALTPQAETGSMELMETIFLGGKLRFHLSGVEGLEV